MFNNLKIYKITLIIYSILLVLHFYSKKSIAKVSDEEKKKEIDALWEDFLKDTDTIVDANATRLVLKQHSLYF